MRGERCLDALACCALGLQRTLGQEPRTAQRRLDAGGGVLLHELDGPAAGKERADCLRCEAGELRQDRLEIRRNL